MFHYAEDELFERNEQAMHRLLHEQTPETFATAYAHYHLVIEGILAQMGYFGMQRTFSEDRYTDLPYLWGLCQGFSLIRQDEGRHVGFGMAKLKELVTEEGVDPQLIDDTVTGLMPLVNNIKATDDEYVSRGISPERLQQFAAEKHLQRMKQIREADETLPDLETLTALKDAR